MGLCGTSEMKKALVVRLHRIEGQIRGICRMIEDDRPCIEVLRQITSVSGALKGFWLQVMGNHVKGCVRNAARSDDNSDQIMDELLEHLKKIC